MPNIKEKEIRQIADLIKEVSLSIEDIDQESSLKLWNIYNVIDELWLRGPQPMGPNQHKCLDTIDDILARTR